MGLTRERIAGNDSINTTIHRCLDSIGSDDVRRRYLKLFRDNASDNWAKINLFRQLVVGGYLAECGYKVEPDRKLDGLTPDWLASGPMDLIAEVCSLYLENAQREAFESGRVVEMNDERELLRLHQALLDKAVKYRDVASSQALGLVLAVFLDLSSPLQPSDVEASIRATDGLFASGQSGANVNGVLVVQERSGRNAFYLFSNPTTQPLAGLPGYAQWERPEVSK